MQKNFKQNDSKPDIYEMGKKLAALLERITQSSLSEKNKQILLDYYKQGRAKDGTSQYYSLNFAFKFLLKQGKDFDAVTKEDVQNWFNEEKERIAQGINPETVRKEFWQLKKFYRISFGLKNHHYPEVVDFLEWDRDLRTEYCIRPNELLGQDKIKELIDSAYGQGGKLDIRNQFLLALCNDTGCRISDALLMNIRDVFEEKNYLVCTFPFTKKRKPRTVISHLSVPYAKKWLALYKPEDKEAPLFIDRFNNRMTYTAASGVLWRLIKKIGIILPQRKKLHLFRHLFSTRAKNWSADLKNAWMGWSSANESGRYTHLDYKDLAEPYFKMLQEENNPMLPKKCSNCGWQGTGDFCERCSNNLVPLFQTILAPDNKLTKALAELTAMRKRAIELSAIVKQYQAGDKAFAAAAGR